MKLFLLTIISSIILNAHFLALIPTTDNINDTSSKINFDIMFIHPFEQTGMEMEEPEGFYLRDKKLTLSSQTKFNHKSWRSNFTFKKPGVYSFYVKPEPYFEVNEEKFISHVPKVIVSAFGREDGWDEVIGLKYEIIPLVKPFGVYKGNLFQGKVLHDGKPIPNIKVEVELYNTFGLKAATNAHITQTVKTDANGVFSFVMNHKGWWGFAALIEEGEKEHEGKMYPIENGALLWIKAY